MKSRLDDLQERMDSASLTEVVRRAIQLLDLVSERQSKGSKIIIQGQDGKEEEIRIVL